MSVINLDVERISSISNEIENINSTLINSYFVELNSKINEIKENVQNDTVHSILGTISEQANTISSELSTSLPSLDEFLKSQMTSYTTSEEQALERLNTVLDKMSTFAGVSANTAAAAVSSSQSTTSQTSQSGIARTSSNWLDHQSEINSSTWDALKSSWEFDKASQGHGAITGTVGAVEDVVEGVVGTAWNAVSWTTNTFANAIQWAGDQVFGDSVVGTVWDWVI